MYLGVDIGTRFTKICLLNGEKLLEQVMIETDLDFAKNIKRNKRDLLRRQKKWPWSIKKMVFTGFGADIYGHKHVASTASCLAAAASHLDAQVSSVIDVGAYSVSVINLKNNKQIKDVTEIEKCAAGSGKFIETIVNALEMKFADVNQAVRRAQKPIALTVGCSVFAESEVISLVNSGANRDDVLAGLIGSMASRVVTLAGRGGAGKKLVLAGGVAKIVPVVTQIEKELGIECLVLPVDSQYLAAYGAALLAQRN